MSAAAAVREAGPADAEPRLALMRELARPRLGTMAVAARLIGNGR
jgi:hypothetical protein